MPKNAILNVVQSVPQISQWVGTAIEVGRAAEAVHTAMEKVRNLSGPVGPHGSSGRLRGRLRSWLHKQVTRRLPDIDEILSTLAPPSERQHAFLLLSIFATGILVALGLEVHLLVANFEASGKAAVAAAVAMLSVSFLLNYVRLLNPLSVAIFIFAVLAWVAGPLGAFLAFFRNYSCVDVSVLQNPAMWLCWTSTLFSLEPFRRLPQCCTRTIGLPVWVFKCTFIMAEVALIGYHSGFTVAPSVLRRLAVTATALYAQRVLSDTGFVRRQGLYAIYHVSSFKNTKSLVKLVNDGAFHPFQLSCMEMNVATSLSAVVSPRQHNDLIQWIAPLIWLARVIVQACTSYCLLQAWTLSDGTPASRTLQLLAAVFTVCASWDAIQLGKSALGNWGQRYEFILWVNPSEVIQQWKNWLPRIKLARAKCDDSDSASISDVEVSDASKSNVSAPELDGSQSDASVASGNTKPRGHGFIGAAIRRGAKIAAHAVSEHVLQGSPVVRQRVQARSRSISIAKKRS